MSKLIRIQGYDESFALIEVNNDIKQWRSGKCFAFYCDNPIYIIQFSKGGIAQVGYCYHVDVEEIKRTFDLRIGSKIGHVENGEIVIDYEKGASDD